MSSTVFRFSAGIIFVINLYKLHFCCDRLYRRQDCGKLINKDFHLIAIQLQTVELDIVQDIADKQCSLCMCLYYII